MVLWGCHTHWVSTLWAKTSLSETQWGQSYVSALYSKGRTMPWSDSGSHSAVQTCSRDQNGKRAGGRGMCFIRLSFLRFFHLLQGLVHHFMSVLLEAYEY